MTALVDTHAHVYLEAFSEDLEAVVARARAAGVAAVVQPAVDVASVAAALALCDRFEGFYAMAAIHPTYVADAADGDLERVEACLENPRVVAVGESGLDYYWSRDGIEAQQASLRAHARMAMRHDLPLVVHDRDQKGEDRSSRDLVRILREERDRHPRGGRLRGVFHCFGGPEWLTEAVLELGFHVGLGGTLTYKNAGAAEAAAGVPLERVVLETDAPYLAPTPHRGRQSEPAHVRLVAERLAEIGGLSLEAVAAQTTANAAALFGIEVQESVIATQYNER